MASETSKTTKKVQFSKLLKWFNVTGLIHTIISVGVFVLSLCNYLYPSSWYWSDTIRILSTITLLNSVVWLVCAIILLIVARRLHNPVSVAKTRIILALSIWFVLTPDILTVILFWLPTLKDEPLINIIGFISPVLVFLGWFIGKRMGKKIQNKQQKQQTY